MARLCAKQGYTVVEIGVPDKQAVTLDLVQLAEWWDDKEAARAKEDWLCFHGPRRDDGEVKAD